MRYNIFFVLAAVAALCDARLQETYKPEYPLDQVPEKSWGLAHLIFNQTSLGKIFYIVDERYYPPYSPCELDTGVASGMTVPKLNVYNPCNHTTYQYKFNSWSNASYFNMTIMHAVQGASLSDNKAHLLQNGSYLIDLTAQAANHSVVDVGYRAPDAGTVHVDFAPKGWAVDVPLND